jgi:hypothetical protein
MTRLENVHFYGRHLGLYFIYQLFIYLLCFMYLSFVVLEWANEEESKDSVNVVVDDGNEKNKNGTEEVDSSINNPDAKVVSANSQEKKKKKSIKKSVSEARQKTNQLFLAQQEEEQFRGKKRKRDKTEEKSKVSVAKILKNSRKKKRDNEGD